MNERACCKPMRQARSSFSYVYIDTPLTQVNGCAILSMGLRFREQQKQKPDVYRLKKLMMPGE